MQYTHKTRNGHKARILATDLIGNCPVVVAILHEDGTECVVTYDVDLRYCGLTASAALDLIPYNPWDDVAVDTKVLVRDADGHAWDRRYFSHYADGRVHTFISGYTSWSNVEGEDAGSEPNTVSWLQAKLAE